MNIPDLRAMDRKTRRTTAITTMVLALVGAFLFLVPSAKAAPTTQVHRDTYGCAGRVTDYAQNGATVEPLVLYPTVHVPFSKVLHLRVVGTPIYSRCITRSDGHGHIVRGPVMFRIFQVSWCWNVMSGWSEEAHLDFQGIRVVGRAYDHETNNILPTVEVGRRNNGATQSVQNCVTQPVNGLWQQQHDLPLWRFQGTVVMRTEDKNFVRGAIRLNPRDSFLVNGPHW